LGTWVTIGNHDGDLLAPHIERFGAHQLHGKFVRVEDHARRDAPIELIGVPSVARLDIEDGFLLRIPPRTDMALRIVLSHFPDVIDHLLSPRIAPDLILSGHTHGGQICLPGGIPIIKHTALPRRLVTGVHRFDKTWLVIGRGLGFATWQIRMFCPAEVIELQLRRKE
jgi:predicted MPP superfamily phosphohydrolase